MEDENLFEIYLLLNLIPLAYIICFICLYIYHYRDGKSRSRYLSKSLLVKSICTILMIFFSLLHTLEAYFSDVHEDSVRYARITFFSMMAISWLLSLYLLIFEYQRWIASPCIGNKWFWTTNLFSQGIMSLLHFTCEENSVSIWNYTHACVLVLGIVTCLILSAIAIFRPEENHLISTEPLLYSSNNSFKKQLYMRKNSLRDNSHDPQMKTFIKECKVRTEGSTQAVYFRILTVADGEAISVLRTPQNFEMLHKSLKLKFPVEDFPSMELPAFPSFTASPPSLDLRMKAYNKYLDELCKPEFMVEALMDFLEIYGELRDRFLDCYKLVS